MGGRGAELEGGRALRGGGSQLRLVHTAPHRTACVHALLSVSEWCVC